MLINFHRGQFHFPWEAANVGNGCNRIKLSQRVASAGDCGLV